MPDESIAVSDLGTAQLHALSRALVAVAETLTGKVVPEALAPADAAALLGIGRTKLHELHTRGLVPEPIELGERCPRWLRRELVCWLLAGAPPRARWNQMRLTELRRAG